MNFPIMMVSMFGAFAVAGIATLAFVNGLIAHFLALETLIAIALCFVMQKIIAGRGWRAYD